MSFLSSLASLRQNSLLSENLFTSPPKVGNFSSLDDIVKQSVTTDTTDLEDYAEISTEAYKRTILDGINIPKSSIASHNNNINNMLVDYLNKDISYDFLNKKPEK